MPKGNPTKYKHIFCKKAREFLAQGYSKRAVAGLLEVNQDTFFEWVKVHPEFAEAVAIGSQLGEANYSKLMLEMSKGAKGSPQAAIFMMKNLYRYSEHNENDLDTKKQPIQINFVVDKPNSSGEE